MNTERRTAAAMIAIFCRRKHGRSGGLCSECEELLKYVEKRLEKCPFHGNKPACSKCPVHCYKPDMRDKIREVMRYAGPRMICRHPLMAAAHYLAGKRHGHKAPNRALPSDTAKPK